MSDYKLNSRAEQYLDDNQGRLSSFYAEIARGSSYRYAFLKALCVPDLVRLRTNGGFQALLNAMAMSGDYEPDPEDVIEAIDYLEATKHEYPEGHPIWQTR